KKGRQPDVNRPLAEHLKLLTELVQEFSLEKNRTSYTVSFWDELKKRTPEKAEELKAVLLSSDFEKQHDQLLYPTEQLTILENFEVFYSDIIKGNIYVENLSVSTSFYAQGNREEQL